MRPAILIIESRREVADALEGLLSSANYAPVVRPYVEGLDDLGVRPAAIIVRIVFEGASEPAHSAVGRLPSNHPPVIAIVCKEEEATEAERLKCDVVLRAPGDLGRLREVLTMLVTGEAQRPGAPGAP